MKQYDTQPIKTELDRTEIDWILTQADKTVLEVVDTDSDHNYIKIDDYCVEVILDDQAQFSAGYVFWKDALERDLMCYLGEKFRF